MFKVEKIGQESISNKRGRAERNREKLSPGLLVRFWDGGDDGACL